MEKQVLVAEEFPEVERYLRQDKAGGDYQFSHATGFAEAIKVAVRTDAHFDFLVTDVLLRPFHGRDLANRMVNPYPRIKVLFMGKQSPRLLRSIGLLPTSAPFLHKPFTAYHLIKSLDELGLKELSWLDLVLPQYEEATESLLSPTLRESQ